MNTDEIIQQTKEYVASYFSCDSSGHDAAHTLRVYHTARLIAAQEHVDLLIVSLAALLHDVDDRKLSPETYQTKQHALNFMQKCSVEKVVINNVLTIIGEVSFVGSDSVVPSTIEGCCVQDADRLDAIGAVGIARAFAYGGSRGRQLFDPSMPPRLNMDAKNYISNTESTTINHFYEKLLLLKGMMNTQAARKMAAHRHQFMEQFLEEFFEEWNAQ